MRRTRAAKSKGIGFADEYEAPARGFIYKYRSQGYERQD